MEITDEAKELWLKISLDHRTQILKNVWCSACRGTVSIKGDKMAVEKKNIVIRGTCTACSGPVARVVETT
jgi:hypothetical protein